MKKNFKAVNANDTAAKSQEKKVFLKDGSVLAGKSIVFEGEVVKVETTGGTLTIPTKDTLRIE